jgi:hypothetical protein
LQKQNTSGRIDHKSFVCVVIKGKIKKFDISQCVLFCHVIKFVIEAALEMSVIVKWMKKKIDGDDNF